MPMDKAAGRMDDSFGAKARPANRFQKSSNFASWAKWIVALFYWVEYATNLSSEPKPVGHRCYGQAFMGHLDHIRAGSIGLNFQV